MALLALECMFKEFCLEQVAYKEMEWNQQENTKIYSKRI